MSFIRSYGTEEISSYKADAIRAGEPTRRCYGCSCRKRDIMFRYPDVDYCVSCEEDDMTGDGPDGIDDDE